jgi:hypothetical protein
MNRITLPLLTLGLSLALTDVTDAQLKHRRGLNASRE